MVPSDMVIVQRLLCYMREMLLSRLSFGLLRMSMTIRSWCFPLVCSSSSEIDDDVVAVVVVVVGEMVLLWLLLALEFRFIDLVQVKE